MANCKPARRRNPLALVAKMRNGAGPHKMASGISEAEAIAESEAGAVHPQESPCLDDRCATCRESDP